MFRDPIHSAPARFHRPRTPFPPIRPIFVRPDISSITRITTCRGGAARSAERRGQVTIAGRIRQFRLLRCWTTVFGRCGGGSEHMVRVGEIPGGPISPAPIGGPNGSRVPGGGPARNEQERWVDDHGRAGPLPAPVIPPQSLRWSHKAAGFTSGECREDGRGECLRPDGSGWVIVRKSDVQTGADHCCSTVFRAGTARSSWNRVGWIRHRCGPTRSDTMRTGSLVPHARRNHTFEAGCVRVVVGSACRAAHRSSAVVARGRSIPAERAARSQSGNSWSSRW